MQNINGCNFELPLPDRETYKNFSAEDKLNILYDLLCVALQNQQEVIKQVRTQKWTSYRIAGALGLVGGILAHLSQKFLGIGRP